MATILIGRVLSSATDSVTTVQGTNPWIIGDGGGSITVDGTVTCLQGTTPWVIGDGGGSVTVDTPQLPAALVGGRLDTNTGSWLGSTTPTVGQKTEAASIPVVLASDQSEIPTRQTSSTSTRSSVPAAAADTLLLAANTARRGATITNDSTDATLLVGLGAVPVSAGDFTCRLLPGGSAYYEVPAGFTGEIRGIWDIASGAAMVTELT